MDLYQLLPEYFQLFGDDRQLGKHLLQPAQDNLDEWDAAQESFQLQLGLQFTSREWCLALQQWVGGYSTRDRWLGIGLNPEWDAFQMRRWLKEAWNYWGIKGTEAGFRKACDLWLDYRDEIKIWNPYPSRWHDWQEPYNSFQLAGFLDQRTWGGGDRPQDHTPRHWQELRSDWFWEWNQVWTCRNLMTSKPEVVQDSRSHLSPQRVWQQFPVHENNWNNVAPYIADLNLEALPANIRGVPFVTFHQSTGIDLRERVGESRFEQVVEDSFSGFGWGVAYPFYRDDEVFTESIIEVIEDIPPSQLFEWGFAWSSVDREVPEGDRSHWVEQVTPGVVGGDWRSPYPVLNAKAPGPGIFTRWEESVGADWRSPYGQGDVWQFGEVVEYQQEASLGLLMMDWRSPYEDGFVWQSPINRETEAVAWQQFERTELIEEIIPGSPSVILGIPGVSWWFNPAPPEIVTRDIEYRIPAGCDPGITMEVVVGYEEEQLPSTPAVPPSVFMAEVPEQVETISTPGYSGWLGRDWLSPWPSPFQAVFEAIETYEVDTTSLQGVESPSIESISTHNDFTLHWFSQAYGVPLWGLDDKDGVEEQVVTPSYLRIVPPEYSFFWGDPYEVSKSYYCSGTEAIPGAIISTPVIGERQLCNISMGWDATIIFDRVVTEIEVPPERLRPLEQFEEIAFVRSQSNWRLSIELEDRLLAVEPSSCYVVNGDGKKGDSISVTDTTQTLEIEFFVHLGYSGVVRSLSLILDGVGLVHYKQPIKEYLRFDRRVTLGFQYSVSLNIPVGSFV